MFYLLSDYTNIYNNYDFFVMIFLRIIFKKVTSKFHRYTVLYIIIVDNFENV